MNAVLNIEEEMIEEKPTPKPESEADDRLVFPHDLSEWLPQENLLEAITAIVEEMNWENPELTAYLKKHPNYRPKMLLRLLSFAYATGKFDTEEIESNCYADPFMRYICEGEAPRAVEISKFRRANRFLLKTVLAFCFKEALKKKFKLGNTLLPAGLRRFLVQTAEERLDLARHLDRGGREL
jgi:transposase